MAKAPPVDPSVRWPRCADCPHRHLPGAPCPRPALWLVMNICMSCTRGRYCNRHDALWAFKGRTILGRKIT